MKKAIQLIMTGIVAANLVTIAVAETPEEKGLAIAKEADLRDQGWGDSTANMVMVLRNKAGKESRREIRIRNMEVDGDGDKSISIFDKPADVKGTAFLSHTHATNPDDQWLYLPALKRVKRISSANKSGPFMGSEFAYEDLSSQEIEKYSYTFLGEEELNGQAMFKIERKPLYAKSGYTRQIAWIDQEHYRSYKVEFYDRKNTLLKTLVSDGFQQYLNKYWRPSEMKMVNHQNNKETDLSWENYQFGNGLAEADFNQTALKRSR
ncbi:MAG: outer membrane lipoprotein-sorting protein [Arenicella sp.]